MALQLARDNFSTAQIVVAAGLILGVFTIWAFWKPGKVKRSNDFDVFLKSYFGKDRVINIDWRGEENEGEIQEFIESLSQRKIAWIKTDELRRTNGREVSDAKFVIKLLKSIDEDIHDNIDSRLLFHNTDGDEYVFTLVDSRSYENVVNKLPKDFFGAGKLK